MRNNGIHKFPWAALRTTLMITIILHGATLYQLTRPIFESGKIYLSTKWQFAFLLGIFGLLIEISLLIASWSNLQTKIIIIFEILISILGRFKWASFLVLILAIFSYPFLIFGRFGYFFEDPIVRLSLLWSVVLIGGLLLKLLYDKPQIQTGRHWIEFFAASLIFTALVYFIATYSTEISDYPFALHWSETSRYYYASLFLPERVYGSSVSPTVLHPTRYLMQAVPFLFPNSTLWMHRVWQVVLWVGITFLTSLVLVYRLSIDDLIRRGIFIAWTFLFLMIGPVYYHLQIPLIILLLGFNRKCIRSKIQRTILSFTTLILASAWAGISRINWFPVPGMLAAMLVLLQETISLNLEFKNPLSPSAAIKKIWINRPTFAYVARLILLIIFGTIIAFSSQSLYIVLSGNKSTEFTSSLTSQLFWYRLFPSSTYPPGILPAILIVSLSLLLLIAIKLANSSGGEPTWRMFHPVRWIGLGLILLVLLLGGLIVSIKIGGGSNLHNLDAYMAMLMTITAFIFFDRAVPDIKQSYPAREITRSETTSRSPVIVQEKTKNWKKILYTFSLGLAYFIPVIPALISSGIRVAFPDQETIDRSLYKIRELIEVAHQKDGEVLFITERHLLTFHYIDEVPLVPDYEKVFLMEMAMGGNQDYLNKFHSEIRNQRYALIISEPLFTKTKGRTERFGEENNVWVDEIVKYLECYYEPERTLGSVNVQLLIPRTTDQICP